MLKKRREIVKEFYNQGMRGEKLREATNEKLEINVSMRAIETDIRYLKDKGELDKDSNMRRKRETIKKFYNQGMTGETLREATNKELGIVLSMSGIEKILRKLKDNGEVDEKANKQKREEIQQNKLENKLKKVEELVKDGKTVNQIADEMKIHRDTVKRYKKQLREQGGLTGKEKPKRQSTCIKEKRMKRVDRLNDRNMTEPQMAKQEGVSRTTIARDKRCLREQKEEEFSQLSEKIIKLYKKFYGQPKNLKHFEEYLVLCKKRYEQGMLGEEHLIPIKYAVIATERYPNIAFYIKLCVRFNQFEEAIKTTYDYVNCENFSQEEKKKMKKVEIECRKFYHAINLIKGNRTDELIMEATGLSKIEIILLRKKVEQQEDGERKIKSQEEHDDGDEKEIC